MTHYAAGTAFEHVVRNDLHANGYWVMRSAGSKTKVDLIAIKPGQILLVQCKRDGRISPAERVELLRVAAMIDTAIPVLAHKKPGRAAVLLDRLTGPGPQDRAPFVIDEVASSTTTEESV